MSRRRPKTTPFDAADYLKSEAGIVEFLNASFEASPTDAADLARAFDTVARARKRMEDEKRQHRPHRR